MKKIFWTSVFWILIVVLFRSYVRLFDHDLWSTVANFFAKTEICATVNTSEISSGSMDEIKAQLLKIETQIDAIGQNIENNDTNTDVSLARKWNTEVSLFYFNQIEDSKLPIWQQINVNSILPVKRMISNSKNIIRDSINLLLAGTLSQVELSNWFTSEFPNKAFKLLNMDLGDDGVLTLTFTEVPGFTSGWSARMAIMANSIAKTAKQFPQVKEVKFMPEELFQP